jgi:hypothetical protein
MFNNIKEDLKLFNEIVDVFLHDEQLNPISENMPLLLGGGALLAFLMFRK